MTSFDGLFKQFIDKLRGGSSKSAASEPLCTPIESFNLRSFTADGVDSEEEDGPTEMDTWHIILTTRIETHPAEDSVIAMRQLLKGLMGTAREAEGILTHAVNEDPAQPENFIVLERFANERAMTTYQKSDAFQAFLRECQPLLAKPLGMHVCKEFKGQITAAHYPFGPPGEGGRDDMIYSARATD